MRRPNNPHCGCANMLIDHECWEIITESGLRGDPGAADTFAHVLFYLKEAILGGPKEHSQAMKALTDGIETAYLHTTEHKLALKLYHLYLTGHLLPENEPQQLLLGAIARGRDNINQEVTRNELRKRRKEKRQRRRARRLRRSR
jgi:hypothetical protein